MKKKSFKVLGLSVIAVVIAVGFVVFAFDNYVLLTYALMTNDCDRVNNLLSDPMLTDDKVLQVVNKNDSVINSQMSEILAENCIGSIKRYDTLQYISKQKGKVLNLNGESVIFACLSANDPDWYAAEILLKNSGDAAVFSKNGISLISASLQAAQNARNIDYELYFRTLYSMKAGVGYDKRPN